MDGLRGPSGSIAPVALLVVALLLSLPGKAGGRIAHALFGAFVGCVLGAFAMDRQGLWLAIPGAFGGPYLPRSTTTAMVAATAFGILDLFGEASIGPIGFWAGVSATTIAAALFPKIASELLRTGLAGTALTAASWMLIRSTGVALSPWPSWNPTLSPGTEPFATWAATLVSTTGLCALRRRLEKRSARRRGRDSG